MTSPYTPDSGDIIWLEFDPQKGHEQAGRRPAVVLSPANYNKNSGLAILCPVTKQVKDYPFEVLLPEGLDIGGVILVDQIKSFDWQSRKAQFCCLAPASTISEIKNKLRSLLKMDIN